MESIRILLLSASRPSRTWKIAERIKREIPEAEISGIIQQALPRLPLTQQLVIAGNADQELFPGLALTKAGLWFRCVLEKLVHWLVWCIHGCPRGLNVVKRFTTTHLAEKCWQAGCPLLLARDTNDAKILDFIQEHGNLVIVLGEVELDRELWRLPARGLVRVRTEEDFARAKEGIQIRLEYFVQGAEAGRTLACVSLPAQPYDGWLGLTLKNDLIADDLLVETAKVLRQERTIEGPEEVARWVHQIYSPYLAQFEGRSLQGAQVAPVQQRYRSTWKLCLDTLLLCSPLFVARTWYRRCRGRYPVLVLTHHLVSDRPHRMGISTESFWRQLRFLQRHYRIVCLSDAVELLRSGNVTAPTVVLTFDDGYRDNFVNLRAIADEVEVPVTLFITTKPVDSQAEFQHDLANGCTGHLPLTWSQICYWAPRGAEFGSHTQTHVDCGSADRTTLEQEIGGSREDMEARLGAPVEFFAFPFGKRENLSAQALEIAASMYSYFASGLDGENLPNKAINLPHLFRKNLYPNRWELELELQSVFQRVDRWKGLLNLRPRAESLQFKRQTASASSPAASGELSSVWTKDN